MKKFPTKNIINFYQSIITIWKAKIAEDQQILADKIRELREYQRIYQKINR